MMKSSTCTGHGTVSPPQPRRDIASWPTARGEGTSSSGIPVVVLSTIVGTGVFASLQRGDVPTPVRVVVGSISILTAVISSLQTFLRYGTGPRGTASRYETLRRDMARVPALPPKARTEPVREMESVRRRMDRYAKESPTIGGWQWGKLERQFHLSKVPQTRPGRDAPSASPGRRGLCRPATRLGRGEIGETLI